MSDEFTRREFLQLGGAAAAALVLPIPAALVELSPAPQPKPCGGWQVPWAVSWEIGESQCHKAAVPIVEKAGE